MRKFLLHQLGGLLCLHAQQFIDRGFMPTLMGSAPVFVNLREVEHMIAHAEERAEVFNIKCGNGHEQLSPAFISHDQQMVMTIGAFEVFFPREVAKTSEPWVIGGPLGALIILGEFAMKLLGAHPKKGVAEAVSMLNEDVFDHLGVINGEEEYLVGDDVVFIG